MQVKMRTQNVLWTFTCDSSFSQFAVRDEVICLNMPTAGGFSPPLFPHASLPISCSHTGTLPPGTLREQKWILWLFLPFFSSLSCNCSLFMAHSFTEVKFFLGSDFRWCTTFCPRGILSCFTSAEKTRRFWFLFLLRFPLK